MLPAAITSKQHAFRYIGYMAIDTSGRMSPGRPSGDERSDRGWHQVPWIEIRAGLNILPLLYFAKTEILEVG